MQRAADGCNTARRAQTKWLRLPARLHNNSSTQNSLHSQTAAMHAARAQASPGRCPGASTRRAQAPRGSTLVARASKRACGGVRRVVGRGVGLQTPPALATSCTERQGTQRGARKIEGSVTLPSAQWRRPSSSGRAGVGRALPARCCAATHAPLRPPSHAAAPLTPLLPAATHYDILGVDIDASEEDVRVSSCHASNAELSAACNRRVPQAQDLSPDHFSPY